MPPLRPDLAQAVNLVRAFVDAEFVATTHRVNFGEWGSRLTTEADYKEGLISYTSPIARALIGKQEGDEVSFVAPGGEKQIEIIEVLYE